MTALVAQFAIRGRAVPSTAYDALRAASACDKAQRRLARARRHARWTGASDIVDTPARFAA